MGYCIQYVSVGANKYKSVRKSRKKLLIWTGVVFSVMLMAIVYRESLRSVVYPGDPEVTDVAVKRMLETLEEGRGVHEAAQVFCEEIINGAG